MSTSDWMCSFDLTFQMGSRVLRLKHTSTTSRVALVGPSGRGKTTMLRIFAGLEAHAKGHLETSAQVLQDTKHELFVPPWKRRIGWVPQEAMLFPHMNVEENIMLGASSKGTEAFKQEVMELTGITHVLRRRTKKLSGGERQRVALARALMMRPVWLLLDEPFAALDTNARKHILAHLREHSERHNLPILLVSHDDRDVNALATHVWTLQERDHDRQVFLRMSVPKYENPQDALKLSNK